MGKLNIEKWYTRTATDIPDGDIYKAWRLKVMAKVEFEALSWAEKLHYWSAFGVLASSSHNSIPQRFKIVQKSGALSSGAIELWMDRRFVLPESDPTGRQAVVSMGSTAGNIMAAIRGCGYDPVLTFSKGVTNKTVDLTYTSSDHSAERYVQLASIEVEKTKETKDAKNIAFDKELIELLLARKMTRAEYATNEKMPADLPQILQTIMKNFSDLELFIADSPKVLHEIGKLQEDADRTVFENKKFVGELGEWLLPNDAPSPPYAIRGKEFGFNDEFAVHVHNGLSGKEQLLPDEVAAFARGGRFMMEHSMAVMMITTQKESLEVQFCAGIVYVEIALQLGRAGLEHSIHAGQTEVEWVRQTCMSTVLAGTPAAGQPLFVMRTGHVKRLTDKNRPHSARPMLEDLIISHALNHPFSKPRQKI